MKTMTTQDHVFKVHLVIDNTERLYNRKIAIYKVHDRRGHVSYFTDRLRRFADDMIGETNIIESADPFMVGLVAATVSAQVYADLLVEYARGEWK